MANLVTIIVGLVLLFTFNFWLGLIFFLTTIPIWVVGFLFEKKYKVVARLSQDQSGDLATRVEEAVHGVRVLKSFGRGVFAAKQFSSQAGELRQTELVKAKAVANIWLYLIMIPELAIGLSMLAGIWLVSTGELTV